MKIFNPATDGSVTCLDIQNHVIQDVLSQLTGKQLNFYAVHGCEIIASSAQTFTGEKILKYKHLWTHIFYWPYHMLYMICST